MKTLMRKLIAQKSHTYGTRQLVAGDEYEASRVHSRVLVAAKLATLAPEQPERPPMVTMTVTRGTASPQPVTAPEATNTAGEPETATVTPKARVPTSPVRSREPRR